MELDEPIEAEMSGVYMIPLEKDLAIVISKSDTGISLVSDVVECPETKREEFLSNMLLANLFGQGTTHAVLGLNKTGKKITLSRHISHDVNYEEFSDIFEDFINTVDFWKDEAQNFK